MRLARRITNLEARLRTAAAASPFITFVEVKAQRSRAELEAKLAAIADRWQKEPQAFAPWPERPEVEKLITATTPEEMAEAGQIRQDIQQRFAAAAEQQRAWIGEWQMNTGG